MKQKIKLYIGRTLALWALLVFVSSMFLFICFLASIPVIIIMAIDSLFGFIKKKLKKPVLIRKGKKRKHD